MKATEAQKLILVMLSDIYEKLDIDNGVDPDLVRRAIYTGNMWGLEWTYTGIFGAEESSESDVKEVCDILDMWFFIESGYEALTDPEKDSVESAVGTLGRDPRFLGFDGNNESRYLVIAGFLINDMDRFTHFTGRDLNSHMPSLDMHRRMLDVFTPMRSSLGSRKLNVGEIISILQA